MAQLRVSQAANDECTCQQTQKSLWFTPLCQNISVMNPYDILSLKLVYDPLASFLRVVTTTTATTILQIIIKPWDVDIICIKYFQAGASALVFISNLSNS